MQRDEPVRSLGRRVPRWGLLAIIQVATAVAIVGCSETQGVANPGSRRESMVSFNVSVVRDGERQQIGRVQTTLPAAEHGGSWAPRIQVDSTTSTLAQVRGRAFGLQPQMDSVRAALGPGVRVQPRISGRRFNVQTSDGRAAHVIASGVEGRNGANGTAMLSFYVEDRLVGLQEVEFVGPRGRRTLKASRFTVFDSTGAEVVSLESGEAEIAQAQVRSRGAAADALARMVASLGPKPAFAAPVAGMDELPCAKEWLDFALALATHLGSGTIAAAATLSCFLSGGLTCPGLWSTYGAVGLSAGWLLSNTVALESCLNQRGISLFSHDFGYEPTSGTSGTGGTGGGGGGGESGGSGQTCVTIEWWTTWDGGYTWSLTHVSQYCYSTGGYQT